MLLQADMWDIRGGMPKNIWGKKEIKARGGRW